MNDVEVGFGLVMSPLEQRLVRLASQVDSQMFDVVFQAALTNIMRSV